MRTSSYTISKLGDIVSTPGDVEYIGDIMMHVGRYEYIGGCSVHRGFQYKSKAFINLLPHMNHDISPMYWASSDLLKISPWCTHGIPSMDSWYPPDVLNSHYAGWYRQSDYCNYMAVIFHTKVLNVNLDLISQVWNSSKISQHDIIHIFPFVFSSSLCTRVKLGRNCFSCVKNLYDHINVFYGWVWWIN